MNRSRRRHSSVSHAASVRSSYLSRKFHQVIEPSFYTSVSCTSGRNIRPNLTEPTLRRKADVRASEAYAAAHLPENCAWDGNAIDLSKLFSNDKERLKKADGGYDVTILYGLVEWQVETFAQLVSSHNRTFSEDKHLRAFNKLSQE